MEVVCKNCGTDEGFSRSVMVPGWIGVIFDANKDGSITATEDGDREVDWSMVECDDGYACAQCGTERSDFLDLVEIKVAEEDLFDNEELTRRWYQCHPIPGQLAFDA